MTKRFTLFSLVLVLICVFAVFMTASADYKDDFSDSDYEGNGWYYQTLLGNPNGDYLFPQRRRISIHLPDYDTTLYMENENTHAEGTTVEAIFENVYSNNSAYGIICHYHDYGWYEFRINVAGEFAGSYVIFKYDQYMKDQGKNPYVIMHPGMDRYFSYDIKLGLNAQNTLKMICEDDQIRVFINGNEQFPLGRTGKIRDYDFPDGDSGVMFLNSRPGGFAQIDLIRFNAEFE